MQVALTLPASDTGLLQWSQNVVTLITAAPATYNLVTADVTTYTALHTTFASSVAACDPSVRNKPAVVAKRAARLALKNGAQILASKVYSSTTVTDAQKTQLGMPPRATPTRIPAPSTAPVIEKISATGWTVRIRLRDASGARRGKPPGTIGASIFSYVGTTAPTDLNAWHFEGSTGKVSKVDVQFPTSLPAGQTVYLTAFWFNGRKQSGPICAAFSTNLPGGGVEMVG